MAERHRVMKECKDSIDPLLSFKYLNIPWKELKQKAADWMTCFAKSEAVSLHFDQMESFPTR